MTFEVGSRVMYPIHGVADVVGRETRGVGEHKSSYLVLEVEGELWTETMTVRVPEDRLVELGVRTAVSLEDAQAVMDVLAVRDPRVATNWSRRFKNHQEKLRTGDAYAVAEVVRNLALRLAGTKLGPAESTMYRQARHALVAELAVSFGISDEAASDRVDRALERSA